MRVSSFVLQKKKSFCSNCVSGAINYHSKCIFLLPRDGDGEEPWSLLIFKSDLVVCITILRKNKQFTSWKSQLSLFSQKHLHGGSFKCANALFCRGWDSQTAASVTAEILLKLKLQIQVLNLLKRRYTPPFSFMPSSPSVCVCVCAFTPTFLTALTHTSTSSSPPREARPQMALMGRSEPKLMACHMSEGLRLQERCRWSRRFQRMGDDSLIVFIHAIFKTHLWINATPSHAHLLLCAQIMQHLAKWRRIRHICACATL